MKTLLLSGKRLEALLEPVQTALEPEGFTVAYLPFQVNFKQQLSTLQPDMLLLDGFPLKPMGGEKARLWLQDLKACPELKELSFLLLGQPNWEDPDELQAWLSAGLEDYLPSNGNPNELVARLRLYLQHKNHCWHLKTINDQLSLMNTDLYERNCTIEKDLYTTRQLQQSLLPQAISEGETLAAVDSNPKPTVLGSQGLEAATEALIHMQKTHYTSPTLKVSGVYLPCDALGGDLYDVIEFGDKSLGVTIADVSGHGVPAGFITAMFKSSFYKATHQHMSPDKVLFHVNNDLAAMVTNGDYVTGLYMRFMPDGRSMEYSGAGHPYPIYYQAKTNKIFRLEENGTPLVWIPDMDYGVKTQALEPGDKILVFTDGVSEIRNMAEEILDEPALEHLFLNTLNSNPTHLLDALLVKLSDYTEGCPLNDDLSMVLIEVVS
jgi:DNA-binding response OmpR family regulator